MIQKRLNSVLVLAAATAMVVHSAAAAPPRVFGKVKLTAKARSKNAVIAWAKVPRKIVWNGASVAGMPVLVKDNVETRDMPTTAGSLALVRNSPGRDAPIITRLRQAGAIILGKTNLSEWANFRSSRSLAGWSAVGSQTHNILDDARTPCGSSSGSAVAVALGLAPAAIGTETDGSITCPASVNGVVGFKPTYGLVSRTHIVPLSHSFDTPGPMARSVREAALILNAIAASDPLDRTTVEADARKTDYAAALRTGALSGARIGVLRFMLARYSAETRTAFEVAIGRLQSAGAVIVNIDTLPPGLDQIDRWKASAFATEFKHDINAYLATTRPDQVSTRNLSDLIAFNAAEPRETPFFGQETFEWANASKGLDDPDYRAALANARNAAGPDGIDKMLAAHRVVALVAPTTSRAATLDRDDDDRMQGSVSTLPAVAGYPHLTVPMGTDRGMPVGISFIGGKWDDARILSLGYAFESHTQSASSTMPEPVTPDEESVGVWVSRRPPAPAVIRVHLTLNGSLSRVTVGASAPTPVQAGRFLDFRFDEGVVRLAAKRSRVPEAYWIQPRQNPLASNPFATPLRLRPIGRGWTASVQPLQAPSDLRLTIERSAEGTQSAYIREAGRNYAGGRRFRVERKGARIMLTNSRDSANVLSGTLNGDRLDLTVPDLGGTIALYRDAPAAATAHYRYRAPRAAADGWRVADAATVGLNTETLEALVRRIAEEPAGPSEAAIHSVMVAYRGRLVLEEYFRGFDGAPHDTRSVGKTLTATIAGAAAGHGVPLAPETRVYPVFARRYPRLTPTPLAGDMRLGDLLSMRSGYACDDDDPAMPGNEDVIAEAGGDIDERILKLPSLSRPGEGYAIYCSVDFHLAGATAATLAGDWLPAMFDRWIARPLDFGPYHWNLTPTGEGYGGGGAYVRPRDLLKIGQLYLSGGQWNGRRVLPVAWTRRATEQLTTFAPPNPVGTQVPSPGDVHGYGYGYGWHRYLIDAGDKRYASYAATGNGGQLVVVIPSLDLVVGFTGGNYGAYRIWSRWMKELVPLYAIAAVGTGTSRQ